MGTDRCQWIRHRLPLMLDGDLPTEERRRVERHLILCPACRGRETSSNQALSALRSVASVRTVSADAPSLWPALARQIRESRHDAPRFSFGDFLRVRLTSGLWPTLGLALGLGGVMAAALTRSHEPPRMVRTGPAEVVPVAPEILALTTQNSPMPDLMSRRGALPVSEARPFEPLPAPRFDYALERGTLVGPGNRDPQHSY